MDLSVVFEIAIGCVTLLAAGLIVPKSARVAVAVSMCAAYVGMYCTHIPNVIDPTVWTPPFPLPGITRNDILSGAARVEDPGRQLLATESFAMRRDGVVYAGTSYGVVIALDENGRWLRDVFFVGGFVNHSVDVAWCRGLAVADKLPWDKHSEMKCGRPLGLRLAREESELWLADAYHGIFKLSISTGVWEHVVKPEDTIVALPFVDPNAMKRPMFFNDVVIDEARDLLFFTDSSSKHRRAQNRQEVIDGSPRGRLFARDLGGTQSLRVLLCGLHFPNGLQLLAGGHLLVVESARFRVLKVDAAELFEQQQKRGLHHLSSCSEFGSTSSLLKVEETPLVSIYLDGLPGFPDNIRQMPSGLLLIGLATKSTKPFSLLYTAYQSRWLRLAIGRLVPMRSIEHFLPRYGLVLAVPTSSGQPGEATLLQDPDGKSANFISEAQIHPLTGALWLGTHHNPTTLSILPPDKLPVNMRVSQ